MDTTRLTRDQLLAEARAADAKAEEARGRQRSMERTTQRTGGALGHLNNPGQYAGWIAAEAAYMKVAADLRRSAQAEQTRVTA